MWNIGNLKKIFELSEIPPLKSQNWWIFLTHLWNLWNLRVLRNPDKFCDFQWKNDFWCDNGEEKSTKVRLYLKSLKNFWYHSRIFGNLWNCYLVHTIFGGAYANFSSSGPGLGINSSSISKVNFGWQFFAHGHTNTKRKKFWSIFISYCLSHYFVAPTNIIIAFFAKITKLRYSVNHLRGIIYFFFKNNKQAK